MNLALLTRGGAPVNLDRERVVFFDKQATFLLYRKYGDDFPGALYTATVENPKETKKGEKPRVIVEIRDVDRLSFFLWAGLQAEARENGETLTPEQVDEWIMPSTFRRVGNAVVVALTNGIHAPAPPGKASAATAPQAAAATEGPGNAKPLTTRQRSASPSRSSAKRPKSSGRRR